MHRPVAPVSAAVPGVLVLIVLIVLIVLFPVVAGASTWIDQPRSFIFFAESAPGNAREFLRELRSAGGQATVIYPGEGAVVYADASRLDAVAPYIASAHEGAIDPASADLRGGHRELLAAVWNQDLRRRAESRSAAAAVGHDHAGAAPVPDGRMPNGRHVPVKLPPAPQWRDAPNHIPYGAQYYDTSSYFAGTTAVGVWLLESVGAAYDWSVAEETATLAGIQQGLDDWAGFDAVSADLSFFLDVHTGVPVSDDPITYAQSTEATWIGAALTADGWTGANAWEQCFQYNNDLRNTFETNWCYSIFIVDSDPAVNQGLFAGGGYAWAYYGGPWIYMSRYSTWAFNSANYFEAVPAHETGHIFWATDEYDGGAQQTAGYLWVPDNGALNPICLMNQNTHTRVCAPTKRQIGWRDTDLNGVMEPLDTAPGAALNVLLPDPIAETMPTWTGTANVTTLPSLNLNDRYSPPHAITVCTIAAVECRVDGGAWSAALSADGAFDAYVEGFSWTAPWLAPGIHVVEARARSSRGIWSDVFGTDTIDVQPPVSVPLVGGETVFRLETAQPNPARDGVVVRYSLPRSAVIRLSIHGVAGRRVRTIFEGVEPAGSHSRGWDGRDDAGHPAPGGVYLVRLDTPEGVRSTKLVRTR